MSARNTRDGTTVKAHEPYLVFQRVYGMQSLLLGTESHKAAPL